MSPFQATATLNVIKSNTVIPIDSAVISGGIFPKNFRYVVCRRLERTTSSQF